MRLEPKTIKGQETLARINEAAKAVIKREGRDRFTTGQVAEEAGMSIGSVYRLYNDRVEILDEVWPERPTEVPW